MKIPLRTVALGVGMLGTAMACNSQASANPVYIGLQDSAVNGGAITLETIGSGSASLSSTTYGDFTVSAQGLASPTLAEPSVQSSDLAAVSTGAQTLNIFVTATNEFPLPRVLFKLLYLECLGVRLVAYRDHLCNYLPRWCLSCWYNNGHDCAGGVVWNREHVGYGFVLDYRHEHAGRCQPRTRGPV